MASQEVKATHKGTGILIKTFSGKVKRIFDCVFVGSYGL